MKFSSTVVTALLLSVIKGGEFVEFHHNVATAINAFSASLYQVISEESSSNLIISPFAVENLLAMVLIGLRGNTADSVSAALYLPNNRARIERGFKTLFDSFKMVHNVTLEIANKIYFKEGINIKDEFLQSLEDNFQASAEVVDFSTNNKAVRQAINDWVEMATNHKIHDFIVEGSPHRDTVLMLINAVYFKGRWQNEFDQSLTYNRDFLLDTKSTKNVQMMRMDVAYFLYGYLPDFDATVLKLPYQGNTMSMLIILPIEVEGLKNLESKFASFNLTYVMDNLKYRQLEVNIPRFEIESTLPLVDTLTKLGLSEILEPGGDFFGMTDADVFVSSVVQKAYIEVTEEGTKAAESTNIDVGFMSSIEEFTADHPFMFLILDEPTDTILFIGRILEPQ